MPGELDELRTQQDQSRARQELLERRQDLFDGRLAILELGAETQGTKRAIMEQGIADVKAEQRAQRTLLHAVHAMQSEHTKTLRQHTADIGDIKGRLGQVEEKLGHVHIGVQAILAVLDRKIDEEARAVARSLPPLHGRRGPGSTTAASGAEGWLSVLAESVGAGCRWPAVRHMAGVLSSAKDLSSKVSVFGTGRRAGAADDGVPAGHGLSFEPARARVASAPAQGCPTLAR